MLERNYKQSKKTILEALNTLQNGEDLKQEFLLDALERTNRNLQNGRKYGYCVENVAVISLMEVIAEDLQLIQGDRTERAFCACSLEDLNALAAEDTSWEDGLIRAISQLQIKKNEC